MQVITCFTSERRNIAKITTAQRQHVMLQQRKTQRTYTEADVHLVVSHIRSKQVKSLRRAEEIYKVPPTTIQR